MAMIWRIQLIQVLLLKLFANNNEIKSIILLLLSDYVLLSSRTSNIKMSHLKMYTNQNGTKLLK